MLQICIIKNISNKYYKISQSGELFLILFDQGDLKYAYRIYPKEYVIVPGLKVDYNRFVTVLIVSQSYLLSVLTFTLFAHIMCCPDLVKHCLFILFNV